MAYVFLLLLISSINNKNVNQQLLSLFHFDFFVPSSVDPNLCILISFGLNPGSVIVRFSCRLKSYTLTCGLYEPVSLYCSAFPLKGGSK